MPRLQDAGGGDTNYFAITSDLARQNQLLEAGKLDPLLANATALQMYREALIELRVTRQRHCLHRE